jgi:heme/copper-type cytochrome/quinol oxidase subunit 1
MTMTESRPDAASEHSGAVRVTPDTTAEAPRGMTDWLTTGDHKKIGGMYVAGSMLVLLMVLVIGGLLGFERVDDGGTAIFQTDAITQLFSLYRFTLVFGVVLPMLLGLAIAIVPLQVGARSVAFPRAAALSMWVWLAGIALMIGAYAANGGPGGGNSDAVDLYLAALGVVVLGLLTGAVCAGATALTLRAPGMRLRRVPMFTWSVIVWTTMLLLSLGVLFGLVIYLYVDHRYGRIVFGGNLEVGGYLAWAVRAPQVYLYALPALGIILDVIATASGRRLQGRSPMLFLIGLGGIFGFGAFAQEAFATDVLDDPLFIAFVLLGIVPVLAVMALGAAVLTGGKPRLRAPLPMVLFSGLLVFLGVATGGLWPIAGLDLQGTVYEQGYVNFVLYGAVLTAVAGIVYWGPKLTGRLLPDTAAAGLGVLGLVGVLAIAVPDIVLGFLGQPEGAVDDLGVSGSAVWNAISAVGYFVLLLVVIAAGLLALRAGRRGEVAGDDPWDGQTLEWATTSPPPPGNFVDVPVVLSPEPLLDRKPDPSHDRKEA